MKETDIFLKVALEAVKASEPIFKKHFGNASGILTKQEGGFRSPVTDIDKEIETQITAKLLTHFPEHSISGEEFPPQQNTSAYTWFIDPIDGTINYIRGLFPACISLGLWEGEQPLLGVIADPINGTLYSAIRGQGAFKNQKERMSVSSVSRLSESMGHAGRAKSLADDAMLQRVARGLYRGREYGSAALELCFIAEGKMDFFVSERIKIYDVAAGIVMLQEAGGVVTDWQGKSVTHASTQVVGSNGKIHEELLATLQNEAQIKDSNG